MIKTYEISVVGFPPHLYNGRTSAKARKRAWLEYCNYSACSYKEFLKMSTLRKVENPPGIGERIVVLGEPATRVISSMGHRCAFMRDGSDAVFVAHPDDVS